MYYPKSQITTNLFTNGNEFTIASTGEIYIGPYYVTSNGDAYSNKSPNDKPTQKLSKISVSNTLGNPKLEAASSQFSPSDDDDRNSYYEIQKGGIYSVVPDEPTAPSPPKPLSPKPQNPKTPKPL